MLYILIFASGQQVRECLLLSPSSVTGGEGGRAAWEGIVLVVTFGVALCLQWVRKPHSPHYQLRMLTYADA
jgi:hypothetical protein